MHIQKMNLLCLICCLGISLSNICLAATSTEEQPWIRLENQVQRLKMEPRGNFLAFTDGSDKKLKILELKSQRVYLVSDLPTQEASFFWSPLGYRLIFREQRPIGKEEATSVFKIYDTGLKKAIIAEERPTFSGLPTLNPRDMRVNYLFTKGIGSFHLEHPDNRLGVWQSSKKVDNGFWIATDHGILWVTHNGMSIARLDDDHSPVESYDISADGRFIAWATQKGFLYTSEEGAESKVVDFGRDPVWHPMQTLLLYAGGRMVGKVSANYDLKVMDEKGQKRWLTNGPDFSRRWPQWIPKTDWVVYTKEHTTDIYRMELK